VFINQPGGACALFELSNGHLAAGKRFPQKTLYLRGPHSPRRTALVHNAEVALSTRRSNVLAAAASCAFTLGDDCASARTRMVSGKPNNQLEPMASMFGKADRTAPRQNGFA
jgi:hypothetical protein